MRLCWLFPAIAWVALAPAVPLPASAQVAREADPATFNSTELIDSGHQFFGAISRGLALTIQEAVKRWGEPNGYILGQEALRRPSSVGCATATHRPTFGPTLISFDNVGI